MSNTVRRQQNGKVERFNSTLIAEWVYARIYTSNNDRTAALAEWLHTYNHHRGHTSIGGPPINRVNNHTGQYSWLRRTRVVQPNCNGTTRDRAGWGR